MGITQPCIDFMSLLACGFRQTILQQLEHSTCLNNSLHFQMSVFCAVDFRSCNFQNVCIYSVYRGMFDSLQFLKWNDHSIRIRICNFTFKWAGGGSPSINWECDFAPALALPQVVYQPQYFGEIFLHYRADWTSKCSSNI